MRYKIIYHRGDEFNIKTKAIGGTLTWQGQSLFITGATLVEVPLSSITEVEMFRTHGFGRMVRLVCDDCTIFLAVVLINIAGYITLVSDYGTGELNSLLKDWGQKDFSVASKTPIPSVPE